MDEKKINLDELIELSMEAYSKAAPGSKERITEATNIQKLYKLKVDDENEKERLSIERYKVETDAYLKEKYNDENLRIENEKLENEKDHRKKINISDIVKLAGFGVLTVFGVAIEKKEGILLNPNFRNLPGKIKFW